MMKIEELKFDERGLIPAVVQDIRTQQVLTLAYMNSESLRRTLETRESWFWSRSRGELWHKGETSGNTQRVVEVIADCDNDAVTVLVEPNGPACHTGAQSCFHHHLLASDAAQKSASLDLTEVLEGLYALIAKRKEQRPPDSYTSYLFNEGLDKILKKVGEEATETIVAAKNEDLESLANESADLLYHLLVLWVEQGLTFDDVRETLLNRRK